MTHRHARTLIAILIATGLASCDGQTTTVTQPASTAPLGRPIGGAGASALSPTDARAQAAARSFLKSYLDVSYGWAKPNELRSASPALRTGLRAQQPRVPEGVRGRRPRVVSLRLEAVGDGRVRATASVDDGDVAPYPLFVTLTGSAGGRWVAVSVGG